MTEGELDKVIKELKNGKATGEDEIAGEYLKNLKEISREWLRAKSMEWSVAEQSQKHGRKVG